MKRNSYNAGTKAAIIEAVRNARKAKKSWAEACLAAKEAGYKGTLPGLEQLLRRAGLIRRRGRKPGRKPAVNVAAGIVKRGPGRPPKAAGLDGIEAMISELIKARVKAVLDKAIAALENLRG